jgi:hypothetical protein
LCTQRATMLKNIGLILLLAVMAACQKNKDGVLPEKPVVKKIEFHVHAGRLYTEPVYQGVTADVKLAVYKINYRNGQSQLLWEKTFDARALAAYPHLPQKFLEEKSFDVLENHEKLQAAYTIRYFTPEGPTMETRAEELVPGNHFVFLDVDV